MNSWQQALKLYNQDKNKYSIPKKDTAEWKAVKEIQAKLDIPAQARGKGIKEVFTQTMQKTRQSIKNNIPPSKDNNPTFEGENHGIHLKKEDGKIKYQEYNYLGPGTKVKKRLQLEKNNPKYAPINNIDHAAKIHDIKYTFDIANDVKKGVDKKIIKKKVRDEDDAFLMRINKAKYEDPLLVSAINKVFYGKKIAEDMGVLDPTAFATGGGMKKKRNKKGGGLQEV